MQHDDLELTDLRRRYLKAVWEQQHKLAELLLKGILLRGRVGRRAA